MREKEIKIIMEYIYNNRCRLDDEVHKYQSNIRMREISVTDLVELIYSTAYRDAFNDISSNIIRLLNLHAFRFNNDNFCSYCRKCKYLGSECEGYECSSVACCSSSDCAYARDFSWCFVPK